MTRRAQLNVYRFALALIFTVLHAVVPKEASAQTNSSVATVERLGSVTPSVSERGVIGAQPGTARPGSAASRIGPGATSSSPRSAVGAGESIRSGATRTRSGVSAIEQGPAPRSAGPGLTR